MTTWSGCSGSTRARADVIDAEIMPDLPEDAVPALEAVRDFFAGQL